MSHTLKRNKESVYEKLQSAKRMELEHQMVQTANVQIQMNKRASRIELALLIGPFGGNINGRSDNSAMFG